jgi:ribosomal subunit interface protein
MKIQVTFRHFNGHHPQLHQAAEELAASFNKYNSAIISTNIEFINGTEKVVNFTVYIKDHTISSGYASDDLHKSLNAAADKVVKQLQKYKEKKVNAKAKVKAKETMQNFNEDNEEEVDYEE